MRTMQRTTIAIVLLTLTGLGGWMLARTDSSLEPDSPVASTSTTDARSQLFYTCPMHPQIHEQHPGDCPICGMKLVERSEASSEAQTVAPTQNGDREILYWYDPMRPETHFDKPGKSPFMDMELVPRYATAPSNGVVEIDPRMAQNLGMRTVEVTRGEVSRRVVAVGSVVLDERRLVTVEARAAGWIERLRVRAVGDVVKQGQVLAEINAPDLRAAQEELALANKLGDPALIEAARSRLALLGVANGSKEGKVALVAPQSGVITDLLVREGAQLSPGAPLMKLADLSTVWIMID